MLQEQLTLNCAGTLVSLDVPKVMGIINLTNDSFYKHSRVMDEKKLLDRVGLMLEEGLNFLDLGAMSSRPGANAIPVKEELANLIPAVKKVKKEFSDLIISVDTYRAEVARAAAEHGAAIINDISGFSLDEELIDVAKMYQMPYILMHMKGLPKNMQDDPQYDNVSLEVLDFFIAKIAKLREKGVLDIIIDPGFGFGKSLQHNYQLLAKLHVFYMLELPILVGISRKSMINRVLKIHPEEALNGTTALHMIALQQGAKILRVHDVKAAKECIQLYQALQEIH